MVFLLSFLCSVDVLVQAVWGCGVWGFLGSITLRSQSLNGAKMPRIALCGKCYCKGDLPEGD